MMEGPAAAVELHSKDEPVKVVEEEDTGTMHGSPAWQFDEKE
jgi:hypothetical protein